MLIWWKVWLIPDLTIEKPTLTLCHQPNNTEKLRFDVVRRECVFFLVLFGKRFESIVGNKKNYYIEFISGFYILVEKLTQN